MTKMATKLLRCSWDPSVDAAYLQISDVEPRRSREVRLFVRLHVDEKNSPVGLEVLDFSRRFRDTKGGDVYTPRRDFRVATFASYDADDDAAYFKIGTTKVFASSEVSPGVKLQLDRKDRLVGVEFLRFAERFPADSLARRLMKEQLSLRPFPKGERTRLALQVQSPRA